MVKVLIGKEPYCIDKAVGERVKKISFPEMNISFYDGFSSEVQTMCQTFPVMDASRLVVVSVRELKEDAVRYFKVPDFTELIILPETIDKRTNVYRELKKSNVIEEYDKLSEKQLQAFIMRFLKQNSGKMTEKAFHYLVERTCYLESEEVNLYTVEVYLKQLMLLGSVITEEAVGRIIPPACNEEVYALSRALTDGDPARALWLCREFLERGEQPISLLSLLLRPFRLGYKASLFDTKEQTEACAMIGVPAYQIRSIMKYPEQSLNQAIDIIQEGIARIKQGGGSDMFYLTISRLIFLLHPETKRHAQA